MPIDATIPLSYNPQTQMGPMKDMLGMMGQMQDLKRGNIALQTEQQANEERKAGLQLIQSDPDFKPNPDGTLPVNQTTVAKLRQAAPQTWQKFVDQANTVNNNIGTANKSLIEAGAAAQGQLAQILQTHLDRKSSAPEVLQDLNTYKQMYPNAAPMADLAIKGVSTAGDNPDQLQQVLSKGVGITQHLISRAEQNTVETDAQGRPYVTQKTAGGQVTGVQGVPVNGQPSVPPQVLPQGETQQTKAAMDTMRQQAIDAAATVPEQHSNNREVKRILDTGGTLSTTGSNADFVRRWGAAIGIPVGEDNASNINSINHHLALQTGQMEKAMNVHTNAGQEVAAAAAGSVTQDPKSLRRTVNFNDATATALDFYNRGKETAIQAAGNDVFQQRRFQNDWTKAYGQYGPYAMRLANAGQSGDANETASVLQEVTGKKFPEGMPIQMMIGEIKKDKAANAKFQRLIQTSTDLHNLATNGHL